MTKLDIYLLHFFHTSFGIMKVLESVREEYERKKTTLYRICDYACLALRQQGYIIASFFVQSPWRTKKRSHDAI